RFDEIRPGCYDPIARLEDMDLDGVWGQLTFPNYARFAGHRFYLNVRDLDAGLVCLRTYNDYLLDEWCATDRQRLYGAATLPLNGVNSMLAAADWLMAGVLERFPGLRLILSEGGAGWIPYLLERADKAYRDVRLDRDLAIGQAGKGRRPPAELFADHMFVCLVD